MTVKQKLLSVYSSHATPVILLMVCGFCAVSQLAAQIPATGDSSAVAESRAAMIAYGKKFIGTPYKYGGLDAKGMDCSGFLFTVARESIGLQLPRSVSALYSRVRIISDSQKEAGDIVFFRTVGTTISHAGLYMGNDQFIHSASDGPNTGVIVSSLKESYWSRTYAGVGQILPSAGKTNNSSDTGTLNNFGTAGNAENAHTGAETGGGLAAFFSHINFDATLTADWTMFSTKRFMLISRGAAVTLNASYMNWTLQPGLGVGFGYDAAIGVINVPLIVTLSMDNGIRVYAGPVLSFLDAQLPDTEDAIKPSVFPGILGVSWQSPSFRLGTVRIAFVQDIHFQTYNKTDESALPFNEAFSAGLVFATGFRLILPSNVFSKK
jgi:hypothetical protein